MWELRLEAGGARRTRQLAPLAVVALHAPLAAVARLAKGVDRHDNVAEMQAEVAHALREGHGGGEALCARDAGVPLVMSGACAAVVSVAVGMVVQLVVVGQVTLLALLVRLQLKLVIILFH